MWKNLSKLIGIFAIATAVLCACATQPTTDSTPGASGAPDAPTDNGTSPYCVAMILPGPINDAGWSAAAYEGLLMAEKDMDIEVAYSENVSIADADAAFTDYASSGYDLIIAHGFDYTDSACKIGPNFPDSKFIVMNGLKAAEPNVAGYKLRLGESGFLAGGFAAQITQAKKIGVIMLDRSETYQLSMDNFVQAAQWINPEIEVLTGYAENANDLAKAKEVTLSMIEQGADVICGNCNAATLGCIEACDETGTYFVGMTSDQHSLAPEVVVVSVVQSLPQFVYSAVQDCYTNNFVPEIVQKGVAEGQVFYSDYYEHADLVTPEIQAKLDEIISKFEDFSLYEEGIMLTTPKGK